MNRKLHAKCQNENVADQQQQQQELQQPQLLADSVFGCAHCVYMCWQTYACVCVRGCGRHWTESETEPTLTSIRTKLS